MEANQDQINELLQKLELLLKKQQDFNIQVNEIRRDIQILKKEQFEKDNSPSVSNIPLPKEQLNEETISPNQVPPIKKTKTVPQVAAIQTSQQIQRKKITEPRKTKSNIEKFIGENLINKIGILITIIGVVIGAKYSIENNLISPLTRIILGYLLGLALLGFGFKLKAKYLNYSAVLVSGALAIIYFITFAAFDLYGLFNQITAFAIMLICTVFGVAASLNYNKQIIAHIGLVGAYAVPFLLSNNSGNAAVLFTYMAIINTGVLVIAIQKYWKALYYVSFAFTWLIYSGWSMFSRESTEFTMAIAFLAIFFLIFYITFLAFKILKLEQFKISDIVMIILNSFLFYGLGISLINENENGESFLGLFTLTNAVVHFIVTIYIYKRKLADQNLFYLTSGFVLTFITIAIPVQLDGNWVTLLWASEAALLFYIGRTKKIAFYEHLSYILILLCLFSLLMDWTETYLNYSFTNRDTNIVPFFNSTMLTSILCILALGFMNFILHRYTIQKKSMAMQIMTFALPAMLLATFYFSFYLEIAHYWDNAFEASRLKLSTEDGSEFPKYNYNLTDLGSIWKLLYTVMFAGILNLLASYKFKNRIFGIASLCFALFVIIAFLTNGLYTLSELRQNFISRDIETTYYIGTYNIYLRYIAIAFFAFLSYTIYTLIKQTHVKINFKIPFELIMHLSIIWIASSELLNWLDLSNIEQSYKLGLSILWGLYALLLIALGIWKKKKHLRIGAIILFSFTLIKLFFYDISSLNTISKTIVFVSLGVLLLIISFLYNKYKHIIADETKN